MKQKFISAGLIVAALGYFVDVFDLLLFSIVRVASLQSLGLSGDELLTEGVRLINMQMGGMLLGGIIWGIWGDKRGRISVLFGSIFLYSIANILNGFVTTVDQYALLRFIAGLGLAGELGAGITLVSETLPKEKRGYGTTLVATIGVAGAVVASVTGEYVSWRTAYIIGGIMGMLLLFLRVIAHESGMFRMLQESEAKRGDLKLLFASRERLKRYLSCILVGLPIWYVMGILMTFSPEIGAALQISARPSAGKAILYSYIGIVIGDLASGLFSQYLRSRKRAMGWFMLWAAVSSAAILQLHGLSIEYFYLLCCLIGFGVGYWAVFVTNAAEQFGTNLRATVTTSVPNFIRGSVVPLTLAFNALKPQIGIVQSAFLVGIFVYIVAALALLKLKESFHTDLDFVES